MYARQNNDGASVNESAVCVHCITDTDALEASYLNWSDAEDVNADTADDALCTPSTIRMHCATAAVARLDSLPTVV